MKNKKLQSIIAVGLMAALCYVGNYLQIKIPNGVLITRIHFGNSMCLLAGLLFGGLNGGLASGIGAALYDLFDPVYIVSAPFTFLSKFAMGFVCGILSKSQKRLKNETAHVLTSAIVGQLVYIVCYLAKTYISQIILGYTVETALTATATNLLTSSVNAVIAVAVSVPLYFGLKKPLASTYFATLINERRESKTNWKTKLIICIVFAVIAVGAVIFGTLMKK